MTRKRQPAADIGDRMRLFRRQYAGCSTQKAFAQALGVDQQRLSGYENGTRVPHHVIAALVRMGANPFWLLFGEGTMRGAPDAGESVRGMTITALRMEDATANDQQLAEFYVLPLYADENAAAAPRDRRPTEIEGPAIIHRAWCPHPHETEHVRVRATAGAMAPTVPEGAIVTIDRSDIDPENLVGKVVAVAAAGRGVVLRRLQRDTRGGYVGVPDSPSPEYATVVLGEGDRLLGLVQTVHARID